MQNGKKQFGERSAGAGKLQGQANQPPISQQAYVSLQSWIPWVEGVTHCTQAHYSIPAHGQHSVCCHCKCWQIQMFYVMQSVILCE